MGLGLGFAVSAQTLLPANRVAVSKDALTKSVRIERTAGINDNNNVAQYVIEDNNTPIRVNNQVIVGESMYDIQCNSGVSNRVWRYEDETMANIWIRGMQNAPSCPDRGTGYNYFNGSDWAPMPEARIEEDRTGWPSYAPYGANGEVVVAHSAAGLIMSKRDTRGSGDWEYSTVTGPAGTELTWPTMCTSGENNDIIHIFANSYQPYMGQEKALIYLRSTDGGATWSDGVVLDGLGSDYFNQIRADEYIVKAKGNVVTLLVGSATDTDLFIMKSEDNGATWEKKMIFDSPIDFTVPWTNNTFDTVYMPDGTLSMDIDDNNEANIAFAVTRIIKTEEGDGYNYYPGVGAIVYWNESIGELVSNDPYHTLDPFADSYLEGKGLIVGWTPDVNNNGADDINYQDGLYSYNQGIAISNFPSIKCQGDKKVVTWCSPHEDYTDGTKHYRHIFARAFGNGAWANEFHHVTDDDLDIFSECVWPELFQILEGDVQGDKINYHIAFQKDSYIGLACNQTPDHDPVVNSQVVVNGEIGIATQDIPANETKFAVRQNYPNPFNGETTIEVMLNESANVKAEVVNLLGQTVFAKDFGRMANGLNKIVIDANSFETGVYFYNVTVNNNTVTKKMIVE